MNTTTVQSKNTSTRMNLWVDLAIFTAILVAFQPQLTGLAIHEWLSLAFGGGALAHVVLHWRWVVNVARRFFQKLTTQTRFYAVLNVALLAALAGVMVSGVMMSEIALPSLGIALAGGHAWHGIHSLSANLIMALTGVHVVVHWKWILNAIKRYVVNPVAGLFDRPTAAPAPASTTPAQRSNGIGGLAVTLASAAWLVGMFGGWVFAAFQNSNDTTTDTTSGTVLSSTQSTSVTGVQSFTPRTRSSQ